MWYKVKELKSKGLNCVQIAHELGLHRQTVMKYEKMTLDEFQASQTYERDFKHKLDIFEEEVKNELIDKPYLSCRQVHDHLRENHSDFPDVNGKTVFNFVMRIREKYHITKTYCNKQILFRHFFAKLFRHFSYSFMHNNQVMKIDILNIMIKHGFFVLICKWVVCC